MILTAILSALGIGGIGALAFFFIPGARGLITGVLDWTLSSARNILIVALVAVFIWGWIGHHNAAKYKRVAASTETALNQRTKAHGITVISLLSLTTAVEKQTAMIRTWTATAEARQRAAQAALREATARGQVTEALAQRIERERAARGAGGPSCPTSPAVMDARGEL